MNLETANKIKREIYNYLSQIYQEYSKNRNSTLKSKYDALLAEYKKLNEMSPSEMIEYFNHDNVISEIQIIYDKIIKNIQNKQKSNNGQNIKEQREKQLIYKIKKDIYSKFVEVYNEAKSDKSKIAKYDYLHKLYNDIYNMNSISDIMNYISNLNKTKASKLPHEVEAINVIVSVFLDVSKKITPLNSPTKRDFVTPKEIKGEPDNILESNVSSDPEIAALNRINHDIIQLNKELVTLNPASKQAIERRKIINKLSDERKNILLKYFGIEGVILSKNLDSLNFEYAKEFNNKKTAPYILTSSEYENELRNTIFNLADLKFNGVDSKQIKSTQKSDRIIEYNKLISLANKKYKNLVTSLYGKENPIIKENSKTKEASIKSDNLLSYFELYNLDGGYNEFKNKKKHLRVGNEIITKSIFYDKQKFIVDMIHDFVYASVRKVNQMGGKIQITDNSRSKEKIASEMSKYMKEIEQEIRKKRQKSNLEQGKKYAHK